MIALALAAATGTPWCGDLTIDRPVRVLLPSAEDDADEVRRRIYHAARALHIERLDPGAIEVLDLHDVHAPLLDAEGHPTEHAAALVDLVRQRGPYGLVLGPDPLSRVAGAPIDGDNGAAAALVTVLEQIATAAQGLVIAPHHTSLTARRTGTVDATAIRGATGLGDSARLVMLLSSERLEHDDEDVAARLGEIVSLRLVKANHVARWEPIELRRGQHGELLPLDAQDRELLADARREGAPLMKRQAAQDGARRQRDAEDDAVVRAILSEQPNVSQRDLRAAVRGRRGCGGDRAAAAIARCRRTP